MKEHYVSYEQAVKLKELGFDWEVRGYYTHDDNFQKVREVTALNHNDTKKFKDILSAPRLDQAAAWLREVKNVIVCPFPERYKDYIVEGIYRERLSGWDYEIWVDEEEYSEPKFGYIESYEKALELGISKALELLGKEGNNGM